MKKLIVVSISCILALSACGVTDDESANGVPDGCNAINVASSPEKLDVLRKLAESFNRSKTAKKSPCAYVTVSRVSSGAGATALVDGWDQASLGDRPVIWTPAASSWGAIVEKRLTAKGQASIVPSSAKSMQLTPLVIAMPKPMADALDYPKTPIGFSDLAALAADPQGWASKGHPEWGTFKLGKTNPNFSTSGLSGSVAQYYAATAKTTDLTLEDLNRPEVDAFMRKVESAAVHYGDTTLTFLNNLYRADRAGAGLSYVSAVAVEEKSVIDYNQGNPDGILDAGEQPRAPRTPLVAMYPKEGTLFSDSPLYVLNAEWVSENQKQGAQRFVDFVLSPESQQEVVKSGFRPGNPQVAIGEPIGAATYTDASQPQTTLGLPTPDVLAATLDRWAQLRKGARVLMVIDVSGSMGDAATDSQTKLDLAKQAVVDSLDEFKNDDQVGVRTFSTNIGPSAHTDWVDLAPMSAIGPQRESIARQISALEPKSGTPLFTSVGDAFQQVKTTLDPTRINAVIVLTDGKNEDNRNTDVSNLLNSLQGANEGFSNNVRIFTIAYGKDADNATLKRIAEATNGANYTASDPKTIGTVFAAVVGNF